MKMNFEELLITISATKEYYKKYKGENVEEDKLQTVENYLERLENEMDSVELNMNDYENLYIQSIHFKIDLGDSPLLYRLQTKLLQGIHLEEDEYAMLLGVILFSDKISDMLFKKTYIVCMRNLELGSINIIELERLLGNNNNGYIDAIENGMMDKFIIKGLLDEAE